IRRVGVPRLPAVAPGHAIAALRPAHLRPMASRSSASAFGGPAAGPLSQILPIRDERRRVRFLDRIGEAFARVGNEAGLALLEPEIDAPRRAVAVFCQLEVDD